MSNTEDLPPEQEELLKQKEEVPQLEFDNEEANEGGSDMPSSLRDKMEQFNDMDFFQNDGYNKKKLGEHMSSSINIHNEKKQESDKNDFTQNLPGTFNGGLGQNNKTASSPNIFDNKHFKDFFEEEQNTKKKTTKKTTTRRTTNGNAETHEKIEETVTEETVTVIKRPIAKFPFETNTPVVNTSTTVSRSKNVAPLIKVNIPSNGSKSNSIPYGVPVNESKETAKNQGVSGRYNFDLDQSTSSYDPGEGVLTKIKEVDENCDDSSSSFNYDSTFLNSDNHKQCITGNYEENNHNYENHQNHQHESHPNKETPNIISRNRKKLNQLIKGTNPAVVNQQLSKIQQECLDTPPKKIVKVLNNSKISSRSSKRNYISPVLTKFSHRRNLKMHFSSPKATFRSMNTRVDNRHLNRPETHSPETKKFRRILDLSESHQQMLKKNPNTTIQRYLYNLKGSSRKFKNPRSKKQKKAVNHSMYVYKSSEPQTPKKQKKSINNKSLRN